MSHKLTAHQIRTLPVQHETAFFAYADDQLTPVEPVPGDWFCEFDWDTDCEGEDFVQDGALVRYVGLEDSYVWAGESNDFVNRPRHVVFAEYGDETRTPRGALLVRQH